MPSLGGYRDGIDYAQWRDYIDKNILPDIDSETLFVCQSIGTQFAVKYIVERNLNIGAYISCAGPRDVLDIREESRERAAGFRPAATTFKPSDEEFEIFKKKKFPKYSFYSDNDNFFEQNNLEKYVDAISSKGIMLAGKGHFSGIEKLEELEDLIEKLVK